MLPRGRRAILLLLWLYTQASAATDESEVLSQLLNLSEVTSRKQAFRADFSEPLVGESDSSEAEPTIFSHGFGHSRLYYGSVHHTLSRPSFFLVELYNLNSAMEHYDVEIFVSNNHGDNWKNIEFPYQHHNIAINNIKMNRFHILAFKTKTSILFVSNNYGESFVSYSLPFAIKAVYISNKHYSMACITGFNNKLYLIRDLDQVVPEQVLAEQVKEIEWTESEDFFYVITIDKNYLNTAYKIYTKKGVVSQFLISYAHSIIVSGSVHAIIVGDRYRSLYIRETVGFKKAEFPEKLKITYIKLSGVVGDEIFVSVTNSDRKSHVFVANKKDRRFVRIQTGVNTLDNERNKRCFDVKVSEQLPGFIMANYYHSEVKNYFPTHISFSNGVYWRNARLESSTTERENYSEEAFVVLSLVCTYSYSTKQKIRIAESAPFLMVAEGMLYKNAKQTKENLYVSNDFGHSWTMSRKGSYIAIILDHGSVIVSVKKYSNEIYYSFDEGTTWKKHSINIENFYSLIALENKFGHAVSGIFFGYDVKQNEIVFLRIDFSSILQSECSRKDYFVFTPGESQNSDCFRGIKNGYWRRKSNAVCKSIYNKLPKIEKQVCPCKKTDFGCSFNYMMVNRVCKQDSDAIIPVSDQCTPGEYHWINSKITKIDGDECISRHHSQNQFELEICRLTAFENVLVFRTEIYFNFLLISSATSKLEVLEPYSLSFPTEAIEIASFDLNLNKECVYVLTKEGIMYFCWASRESFDKFQLNHLLREPGIEQIMVDSLSGNLYYRTSKAVFVLSTYTMHKRQLVDSECEIENFLVLSAKKMLLFNCKPATKVVEPSEVTLTKLTGELVKKLQVPHPINSVAHDDLHNTIYLFGPGKRSFIHENLTLTTLEQESEKGALLGYDIFNGLIITYKVNQIKYQDQKIAVKSMREAHLYFQVHEESSCADTSCPYICIPTGRGHYMCICPDNMEMDEDQKCVCDKNHPDCDVCTSSQFRCLSGMCIDAMYKCNGVHDCDDSSDESNCNYKCSIEEFQCFSDKRCIPKHDACNGVPDCQDGSDEANCSTAIECKTTEFTCSNRKCIPVKLVCDGFDNCGDNSDEIDCQEMQKTCTEAWQFKCDNGECIAAVQRCDNVIDCTDWSDEKKCKSSEAFYNKTCALICDKRCIHIDKLCDHYTDCSDASDEIFCGFEPSCEKDSLSCPGEPYCLQKDYSCSYYSICKEPLDLNCVIDRCNEPRNFKCDNKEKCIEANRVCDGIYDCADNSDEMHVCENDRVHALKVVSAEKNHLTLHIIGPNNTLPSYLVETYSMINNKIISTETYNKNLVSFSFSSDCDTFRIYVSVTQNPSVRRFIDFTPKTDKYKIPTNLKKNDDLLLEWQSNMPSCYPRHYYVRCSNGAQDTFHTLTTDTNIRLPKRYGLCQVATCPYNIFNYECGRFASVGKMPTSARYVIVGILVVCMVLTVATVMMVSKRAMIRDYFTSFYYQRLSSRTPQTFGYSQAADRYGIFNEMDEILEEL